MYRRILKCVISPTNSHPFPLFKTTQPLQICPTNPRFYTIENGQASLRLLKTWAERGVDLSTPSGQYGVLKTIHASLCHNLRNKQEAEENKDQVEFAYSLLKNVLTAIGTADTHLPDKTKLATIMAKITKVSTDEDANARIHDLVHAFILSANPEETAGILKTLIKNKYDVDQSVVDRKVELPKESSYEVLFDLYWCLTNLRVDPYRLMPHLQKLILQAESANVVDNLKLLYALYINFTNSKQSSAQNNIILSNNSAYRERSLYETRAELLETLKSASQTESGTTTVDLNLEITNQAIEYLKKNMLSRLGEFDNTRSLCNLIFYITSTVNNFTISEYRQVLTLLLSLIKGRRDLTVEGMIQLFWSLQKNNIYSTRLLRVLTHRFKELVDGSFGATRGPKMSPLSVGQLSLALYSLTYFNLLDTWLSMKSLKYLRFLKNRRALKDPSTVLKEVNVIWAVCVSNVNEIGRVYPHLIEALNSVDWDNFATHSQFEDLRKVMQILTVLKLEGGSGLVRIPKHLLKMVADSCDTNVDYKVNSVTQDKVRRALQSNGINFKSEYMIDSQISVDFILFKDEPGALTLDTSHGAESPQGSGASELGPGKKLVIEIDGPYHYNLLIDGPGEGPEGKVVNFGILNLVNNGKTIFRNRILRRLGFEVVSIPWFEGYQKSFYPTVHAILVEHGFARTE